MLEETCIDNLESALIHVKNTLKLQLFGLICAVATDNDATKIVNSVATFVRSVGYLFTSEGFVLTLIKVNVPDIKTGKYQLWR